MSFARGDPVTTGNNVLAAFPAAWLVFGNAPGPASLGRFRFGACDG